jgi:hypothetical protein
MSGSADPAARKMTVVKVREPAGADHAEVTFLESARFYRLLKSNPGYGEFLARLKEARAEGRSVTVRLPSIDSDLIEAVDPAR